MTIRELIDLLGSLPLNSQIRSVHTASTDAVSMGGKGTVFVSVRVEYARDSRVEVAVLSS